MAVNAQLTEEDEERLAALWAQPLDAADVGDQSAEDGISALFSAPAGAAAHSPPHQPADARRSAPRRRSPRSQRSRRRRLRRSRPTSRLLPIGAVLVVAPMLVSVALSALTGPGTPSATYPRATADPPPAASPPTFPSRGQRHLRRVRSTQVRAHRRHDDRQAIAGAHRRQSQAARRDRAARRTRAQQRRRSAHRFVATPVAPRTPRQHRVPATPAPVSSACEEFPPC